MSHWLRCKSKVRAFTLIEMMIVVAIIAILAAVAYPAYVDQVTKARRADGKGKLLEILQAQERYYTSNATYSADLTLLGYASAGAVPSDEGWYNVGAAACGAGIGECVALTATPQGAQAGDGACKNLTLNSRGLKGISGTGTVAECW